MKICLNSTLRQKFRIRYRGKSLSQSVFSRMLTRSQVTAFTSIFTEEDIAREAQAWGMPEEELSRLIDEAQIVSDLPTIPVPAASQPDHRILQIPLDKDDIVPRLDGRDICVSIADLEMTREALMTHWQDTWHTSCSPSIRLFSLAFCKAIWQDVTFATKTPDPYSTSLGLDRPLTVFVLAYTVTPLALSIPESSPLLNIL
jgi:hypothetical protein